MYRDRLIEMLYVEVKIQCKHSLMSLEVKGTWKYNVKRTNNDEDLFIIF